jgi:hypothetical protein
MRLHTKEEDDKRKDGLQGSGWASFLLSPFFSEIASSLLFLAASFQGIKERGLKEISK